jgi:uncharacterized protein
MSKPRAASEDILDQKVEHEEIVTLDEEDEKKLRISILHDAIKSNQMNMLQGVLDRNPDLLDEPDENGITPVLYATKRNRVRGLMELLERGAKIEVVDRKGFTVLHWACRRGFTDCVRILLNEGALPLHEDGEDQTQAIHWAAYSGKAEIMDIMLEYGAKIDARDKYGYTPLHWACRRGEIDTAEFILKKGGSINEATIGGLITPLHCACFEGHKGLAVFLIDEGASIEAKNAEGYTPLELWAKRGGRWGFEQISIADLMLELHSDTNEDAKSNRI